MKPAHSAIKKEAPLPQREGVGASSAVLPVGPWRTVAQCLIERFPAVGEAAWMARITRGDVVDEHGQRVTPERLHQPLLRVFYYRELPPETRIEFDEVVLHQDAQLLVVDKPHFLPVVPSGKYLQETLLVRLKKRLNLPELAPLHRIDRDTAGLVLFAVTAQARGPYHALFREHRMAKSYVATAHFNPAQTWPQRRASRIVPSAHFMQQCEVPATPEKFNAITDIRCTHTQGSLAHYALQPLTGQRHQLRVHMAALGLPILGDGIYPVLTPEGQIDHQRPLQLVAHSLEFTDPFSGAVRRFESQRQLLPLAVAHSLFGHPCE